MLRRSRLYTYEEVLNKLLKFCAYQERSTFEVKLKAEKLGANNVDVESLLSFLKDENFINEERFAHHFVQGKVSIKKWGKYKLIEGLRQKGVGSSVIDNVINELDKDTIKQNIRYWLNRKLPIDKTNRDEKSKLYRFLMTKGFEHSEVMEIMKKENLM